MTDEERAGWMILAGTLQYQLDLAKDATGFEADDYAERVAHRMRLMLGVTHDQMRQAAGYPPLYCGQKIGIQDGEIGRCGLGPGHSGGCERKLEERRSG